MNKIKIILLVLTILLIAGIAEAQDQIPINPAPGYYGMVTINGQQAPPGTTIIAKIGLEERGSIPTSVSGFYGEDPGPSKLWVKGFQNEVGSTVTFFYNNVAALRTAQLTGAGTLNRVDLDFVVPVSAPGGVGPGGPGSSGGGGGGGGVISAEPFENIEFYETREADLVAGIPVTFRFTNPQLAVYELVITANISAGLTSSRVEQLKGTSKLVTSPPAGTIHKNVNIWLGTSGFAVPRNIREGIIRFKVNNGWLSSENIDAGTISMMKWDGSQWISLETKQTRKDDNFAYYEAKSNSFSPFAISGVKTATTGTPATTATPGASSTAAPLAMLPPTTSLNWILYVIVAIIIIAAVYYNTVKKKVK